MTAKKKNCCCAFNLTARELRNISDNLVYFHFRCICEEIYLLVLCIENLKRFGQSVFPRSVAVAA